MTDLEMTSLCAQAMELRVDEIEGELFLRNGYGAFVVRAAYDPLNYDAQALSLVKHLKLNVGPPNEDDPDNWCAWDNEASVVDGFQASDPDLNRAIVEVVAKIQRKKQP